MNPETEISLVEAAQKGSVESFGALYEKYYSSMAALAFSILTDRQFSEDAAQETFAIACVKIGSLKSKDKFAPWLAGICRNVARQMLRSNKLIQAASEHEVNHPHPLRMGMVNQAIVKQALGKLKNSERELIITALL